MWPWHLRPRGAWKYSATRPTWSRYTKDVPTVDIDEIIKMGKANMGSGRCEDSIGRLARGAA